MKKNKRQQLAYTYIKANISEGKWENDIRLIEQDISDELSISRTPIREAIDCLISEGYLTKKANHSVVVSKKNISEKEFIERTQLLEQLLSNYLYQLQIKQLKLDIESMSRKLGMMRNKKKLSEKQVLLTNVLIIFLEPLDNQVIKRLILKNFEQLQYIKFPNTSLHFFYDEIMICLKNISQHISQGNYDLGRKDIRVFFNRINLELIDQQL